MADRDKDLTHLFVRDLDEIPLPARGAWRRVSGRETTLMRASRSLLAAGAVVAVLAIALIIGFQLRDRSTTTANPSASPTPSTSGAIAVPSATATASSAVATSGPLGAGIYNDDFGFIVTTGDIVAANIRTESSNTLTGSFASQVFAVSPDGKSVAYWTLGTGSVPQLRTFTTLGNATEQTWVTLAAGQRGGGVAWSSDGAGLLYSTETGNFGVGGITNGSTLNVYELAANGRHGTTIDTQTNTGWLYRPIAWDRSANLAAAGLTGEGAGLSFYVTVRINPDGTFTRQQVDTKSRTTFGMPIGSIKASSDAKLVLGVDFDSGDIKWWPLADYAANRSQAGAGRRGALWRPGTHEIGFMSAEQLWLGDVDKFGPQGLCCTAFSGAPATSTLRTFRADGTAVVLAVVPFRSPALGATDYTLVRLGSDPKATTGDRVSFQDLGGLVTSVRLR